MKKLIFILFTQFVVAQQIPIDSISYQYFYEKELQQIVHLKKQQNRKRFNAKAQFEIAELYKNINCEDSAYSNYYKVYEFEKVNKTFNDDEFKELLFQIHKTEKSKHNYSKDRGAFLTELEELSKKDKKDKWRAKAQFEIATNYFKDSVTRKVGYLKMLAIQNSNFYSDNSEFRAATLSTLGNFNIDLKNYRIAESFLNESYFIAKNNRLYLRQVYAKINLAVNEIYQNNYQLALSYLNDIEEIPNKKFLIKINRIVHKLKKRAYDGLKDIEKSKIQELYINRYDSLVDDFRKNSNFYEIDVAYQTKEKDKKIKELSSLKQTFNKNRAIYSSLLFLVFLLALYSFLRWKKSDRKKRLLNIENERTKAELKTVKSLVTKDYILLKNKSKVYLNELIYIKSDGHYLNLYTTVKKEFVRGRISEIEQQLPPNFIKCHRSYIVNQNYIKQYSSVEVFMVNGENIPLSRGFKF